MKTLTQIINEIEHDSANLEFLPTGLNELDNALDGGFMRKELVVLGAFTGIGKSMIASQIFYNIATQGFKSAYFSLEISNKMIVSRLIGGLSNIKPARIIKNALDQDEMIKKQEAENKIIAYEKLIHVYDDLYRLDEITANIKKNSYDFIVIDFIQNIIAGGTEYERLSAVSLHFQKLAKETNSCIMLVSQLSNDAAKSGAVEYKGSGGIATVADLGFFLKRGEGDTNEVPIQLNLRKNRRGFSGLSFDLRFQLPGGKIL